MRGIEVDPLNTRLLGPVPGAGGDCAFHGKRENEAWKNRVSARRRDCTYDRSAGGKREREREREGRKIDENKDRETIGRMTYLTRYRRNMAPKELYRAISSGDLMSLFRENRPRVSRLRLCDRALAFDRTTPEFTRCKETHNLGKE